MGEQPLATTLTHFFAAFMITDIFWGVQYYARHFAILEGWVHHFVYIIIVWRLTSWRVPAIFQIFALEELPTCVLAVGHLGLRSDWLFGLTFLLFRLGFHLLLSYHLLFESNDELLEWGKGRRYPNALYHWAIGITVTTFILHLHWFISWCRGMIRRSRRKEKRQ